MASTFISTDQLTTQTIAGAGDTLTLLQDVQVFVNNTAGIVATGLINDTNVNINGSVLTQTEALFLVGTSDNTEAGFGGHSVFISQTGSVQTVSETHSGILLRGTDNLVVNHGAIRATGKAVEYVGDDGTLVNYGTITSTESYGIYVSRPSTGATGNEAFEVTNYGEIFGLSGVWAVADLTLNNYGSITSTSHGVIATGQTSALNVTNSGLISSRGSAIASSSQDDRIVNSGHIDGNIVMNSGDDIVVNIGTINGNITMGNNDDIFDGRGGTVIGVVSGGNGNDTYIIDDATIELSETAYGDIDEVQSTVGWALADNFENLTLIGSDHVNGTGNSAVNVVTGNSGDNVLSGKGGADTLAGADGDDTLRGGAANDTLKGQDGDDKLRGGRGDDTLKGGNDNDVLVGGAGKDALTGGNDEDVFRFTKVAHSTNDANADSITDFESGADLIDLGAFAGKLKFIGSSTFSGDGEVRVTESGGDSIVRVDVDGDGVADMKIKVLGVVGLDAGDFLL